MNVVGRFPPNAIWEVTCGPIIRPEGLEAGFVELRIGFAEAEIVLEGGIRRSAEGKGKVWRPGGRWRVDARMWGLGWRDGLRMVRGGFGGGSGCCGACNWRRFGLSIGSRLGCGRGSSQWLVGEFGGRRARVEGEWSEATVGS